MDKNEYKLKLQEINEYVDKGDYEAAAQAADTVDWKRVRNVRTLCMISEIYEAVDRYEDSKALLVRAYHRSPVGRAILYRLVEVTTHLKQFDEAIEYYSEYCQAAPHDTGRFILKYKIYRGRGSSVEEQIDILKEYLDQEYSDKYAYELAKLYQQADRIQECLATCDDLVLWYHSGKYVTKALELKMRYAQLTPKQQEIYDHRFDPEQEELDDLGVEELVSSAEAETEADSILKDAEESIARDVSEAAVAMAEEKLAEETAETVSEEAGSEEAAAEETPVEPERTRTVAETFRDVAMAAEAAAQAAQEAADKTAEDLGIAREEAVADDAAAEAEAEEAVQETVASEEAPEARIATEEEFTRVAPAEADRTAEQEELEEQESFDEPVADAQVFDEQLNNYNTEQLQDEAARSMRALVSGIGRRDYEDPGKAEQNEVIEDAKKEQEDAAEEEAKRMQQKLKIPRLQRKAAAGHLSIDDILLSMGDKGEHVREAVAKAGTPSKPQPAGVLSAVDEALLNLGVNTAPMKQNPEAVVEEIAKSTGAEDALVKKAAVAEEAEEAANAAETAEKEIVAEAEAMQKELGQETGDKLAEDLTAVMTDALGKDAAELISDAASKVEEQFSAEELAEAFEEEKEADAEEADDVKTYETDQTESEEMDEDVLSAKTRVMPTEEIAARYQAAGLEELKKAIAGEEAAEETAAQSAAEAEAEAEQEVVEEEKVEAEVAEQAAEAEAEAEAEAVKEEAAPAEEAPKKAPRKPSRLDAYERELFAGFLQVGELDEQIGNAIEHALEKGPDRTSRTGNVLIFGPHGSGKTTMAVSLAKAIARERGSQSVKMARIYATDLNRKDIAATIAKIAGGILIIEEAGDLEDQVADQLTTAMEFRTDGLVIIMEDEQKYIHDLLMRHPRFTMKFTSQIFIPEYSVDEFIGFGQVYAEKNEHTIGEEGAAALGNKITAIMDGGEAVTIGNVIDLVDEAIKRSDKFTRKLFAGKKRYDEMNRVILTGKDFK